MKNAQAIGGLSRQLQKVSERIELLAMDADGSEQNNSNLTELYMEHLLSEVSCAQDLILKMTDLAVEATSREEQGVNGDDGGDGSAFTEGDLTATKGEVLPTETEK